MSLTPIYIFLGLTFVGTIAGLIVSAKHDNKKIKEIKKFLEEKKRNGV